MHDELTTTEPIIVDPMPDCSTSMQHMLVDPMPRVVLLLASFRLKW